MMTDPSQNQSRIFVRNQFVKMEDIVPDLFQCIEIVGLDRHDLIAKVCAKF